VSQQSKTAEREKGTGVELREYAAAARRRWRLIAVVVVATIAATAALTLMVAPTYRSSTVLFVSAPDGDPNPDLKAQRLNSYVALLTGPRIAGGVAAQLGLPLSVSETQAELAAEVQPGTDLLVVSATDRDPGRARAMATAAGEQLTAVVRELEPTPAGATGAPVTITVAQKAVTAQVPQNLSRNLGVGVVLGILLAAAAAAAREALDTTVRTERDLQRSTGIATIGVIELAKPPGKRSARRDEYADAQLAEAFRQLRTTSLLVTSSTSREGTTAVTCGLAVALAETGSRVVLVDANLREPGVATYLAVDSVRGLADVLAGTAPLHTALHEWGGGRLTVLPAGFPSRDPGELLAAPTLAKTIATLEDDFDIVLIDAPPLLSAADAAVLSSLAGGVLLVIRAGRTRAPQVQRAAGILDGVGAQLLGAVLNTLPKKLSPNTMWRRNQPLTDWRVAAALPSAPAATAFDPEAPAATAFEPEIPAARGRATVNAVTFTARGRASVVPNGEPEDGFDDEPAEIDEPGATGPSA
jgi:capsular exopolysaccharide synthesis family protein